MSDDITMSAHGNLTADPELKTYNDGTGNETIIVSFSIANSPRQYNRNTRQYENGPTTFITCKAFGALAKHVAQTLHKGDRVIVNGVFSQREYTTQQGETRRVYELKAHDVAASLQWCTGVLTRVARNQNTNGQGAPQSDPWSV